MIYSSKAAAPAQTNSKHLLKALTHESTEKEFKSVFEAIHAKLAGAFRMSPKKTSQAEAFVPKV
jgi:hypothetical protein